MHKALLLVSFIFLAQLCMAQSTETEKYYDSTWNPVSKNDAFYVARITKTDTGYFAKYYITATGTLNAEGIYRDTSLLHKVGYYTEYYPNGKIKESSRSNADGNYIFIKLFYPDGKLEAEVSVDPITNKSISRGFDNNGNELKNYIYLREAEFPGGTTAYLKFLQNNIKSKVPVKNGAPVGTYTVLVRFVIDNNGKTTDIVADTHHGYGMEEEVIRVIAKSPRWIPCIYKNKPVNAYRRQPLTFQVDLN